MAHKKKRRQFHLSVAEEQILYEISRRNNISEAEAVRMAIQKLGAESNIHDTNPLLEMAQFAKADKNLEQNIPTDVSENFKKYFMEILDHENQ